MADRECVRLADVKRVLYVYVDKAFLHCEKGVAFWLVLEMLDGSFKITWDHFEKAKSKSDKNLRRLFRYRHRSGSMFQDIDTSWPISYFFTDARIGGIVIPKPVRERIQAQYALESL